jgi:hypothetical protein
MTITDHITILNHPIGADVLITITGDEYIDRYAGIPGKLIGVRNVSDGGYLYTQVCIKIGNDEIWVNDNEYTNANQR